MAADPAAVAAYRDVMTADPPADLAPVHEEALGRVFGELWQDPALGRRQRRLVTITCVSFEVASEKIAAHVHAALNSGDLTIDELLEVVLHFAVYCGWPKASHLEMHVRQAWADLQRQRGEDPRPLPARDEAELGISDWGARLRRGEEEFLDVNLIGAPPGDSPYQHAGILGFVFGHVWQRPGLSRRDRRFVTLAAVGACRAPMPIASHVGSALKSGDVTEAEMDELIRHFAVYGGADQAAALRAAADGVLAAGRTSPA